VLAILPKSRTGWTRRTWAVGFAYAATMVLFVVAKQADDGREHDLPAIHVADLRDESPGRGYSTSACGHATSRSSRSCSAR